MLSDKAAQFRVDKSDFMRPIMLVMCNVYLQIRYNVNEFCTYQIKKLQIAQS